MSVKHITQGRGMTFAKLKNGLSRYNREITTYKEMTMTQPQKQQQAGNLETPNMYVWRLTRRLAEKRESTVNTGILRRMPH